MELGEIYELTELDGAATFNALIQKLEIRERLDNLPRAVVSGNPSKLLLILERCRNSEPVS